LEFFENIFTISQPGVFALRRPLHYEFTPREHPEILAGIGGYGITKSGYRRTKVLIICETRQDRTKVEVLKDQ